MSAFFPGEKQLNPRTPVIIGVAQHLQKLDDARDGLEPVQMMVKAAEAAGEDARVKGILGQVESVRVIRGVWRYDNPARFVAEAIGVPNAETVGTPFGGNTVQSLVNHSALQILAGERELVLMTGAENGHSQARARKGGFRLPVTECPGAYDVDFGDLGPMAGEAEMARGMRAATAMYPIFENAIRYARGESLEAHITRVSELWSRFSAVAEGNPNAWLRSARSAEEIRTPSASNRPVSFPYPKLMNSNNAVDMSAALIIASVAKARALGVPESQWVYPLAGTDAHDHYLVSERDNLHSSPGIRLSGQRLAAMLGDDLSAMDHIDIYSCFPSAVQVGAAELGLDENRQLTVTGGLTFGGGPLNNYVMHSIARTVEVCRAAPGSRGFVTANGGYLTKHALGVYSTGAPAVDFQHANVQDQVDALPRREWTVDHDGPATIESYTVLYGADGPNIAHAACLLEDGRRTWANNEDRTVLDAMVTEEFCARPVAIDGAGNFSL